MSWPPVGCVHASTDQPIQRTAGSHVSQESRRSARRSDLLCFSVLSLSNRLAIQLQSPGPVVAVQRSYTVSSLLIQSILTLFFLSFFFCFFLFSLLSINIHFTCLHRLGRTWRVTTQNKEVAVDLEAVVIALLSGESRLIDYLREWEEVLSVKADSRLLLPRLPLATPSLLTHLIFLLFLSFPLLYSTTSYFISFSPPWLYELFLFVCLFLLLPSLLQSLSFLCEPESFSLRLLQFPLFLFLVSSSVHQFILSSFFPFPSLITAPPASSISRGYDQHGCQYSIWFRGELYWSVRTDSQISYGATPTTSKPEQTLHGLQHQGYPWTSTY